MKVVAERGYLIPAIGNVYEKCADRLRDSILKWHPDANITIVTKDMLPYGDRGGFANDWQMFWTSPYRQTVKLEADMLCASPIDHWWTMFEHRDVVISTGCRDFYDRVSTNRKYRYFIDINSFPDVYNAVTYWRLSQTAQEFWQCVRDIFENWDKFKTLVKFPEDVPSTDFVYAMAAAIVGPERVTIPASYPKIVHMKPGIIPVKSKNWSDEIVWEIDADHVRINTVGQFGLVHYQVKDWVVDGQ